MRESTGPLRIMAADFLNMYFKGLGINRVVKAKTQLFLPVFFFPVCLLYSLYKTASLLTFLVTKYLGFFHPQSNSPGHQLSVVQFNSILALSAWSFKTHKTALTPFQMLIISSMFPGYPQLLFDLAINWRFP